MKIINNNIQESYCSFEVSKLLKCKGLNIGSKFGYTNRGTLEKPYFGYIYLNEDNDNTIDYEAPTHALAIEWIRVNFDIWVKLEPTIKDKIEVFVYKIGWKYIDSYNSPQEATEAGLLYILTNLI